MSTGGEVANALVCKTSIRGFNSRPVLQYIQLYSIVLRCFPPVLFNSMKVESLRTACII